MRRLVCGDLTSARLLLRKSSEKPVLFEAACIACESRTFASAVDDQYVPPGAEIVDKRSGKKVGKVTAALGSRGLALLRLETALKEGAQLEVAGKSEVKAIRPTWWPQEWGREGA